MRGPKGWVLLLKQINADTLPVFARARRISKRGENSK
jgi:hypothetical protein